MAPSIGGDRLFKIANDIRLLGSGPRSVPRELILPENEPGSSIMPGKGHRRKCEAMTMVCCQVFGNQTTVTVRRQPGTFRMKRLQAGMAYWYDEFHSTAVGCSSPSFTNIAWWEYAPTKAHSGLMERSLMLVTALAPKSVTNNAAKVAKSAQCARHHIEGRGSAA